ncbi:MAG: cysteine--tRNA ligase [bacterium]|nr:cysteine--tRNA ligase [bacterium]
MKIYNTLTRKKEEFVPIEEGKIKMYVCGLTPYSDCHMGHTRCYVTFDVIRRYMEYKGYEITFIQNFTDIDDKIIERAKQRNLPCEELAKRYIDEYFKNMDKLCIKRATLYPRVTEHIQDVIDFISVLIEKGSAYQVDGDVFFEVSKFKEYGKLSGRNVDEMIHGTRFEVDARKKAPTDFALWKSAKEGEPYWDSPFGKGRPGWHIECSAMSIKYLGETFDIHGGGQDLVFPHHENELAQSESYTGKTFANLWIHNGMVTLNQEKMSKSLGNEFLTKNVLEKYSADVVRLFFLGTYYKSPVEFSLENLNQVKAGLERFYNTLRNVDDFLKVTSDTSLDGEVRRLPADEQKSLLKFDPSQIEEKDKAFYEAIKQTEEKFTYAMDDDFNTPVALASLYDLVTAINKFISKMDTLYECNRFSARALLKLAQETIYKLGGEIFGLFKEVASKPTDELAPELMGIIINIRQMARAKKDWELADKIRTELDKSSIILEDTPQGTKWRLTD